MHTQYPSLIFIEIIDRLDFQSSKEGDHFGNPLLSRIKKQNPDILIYEMDNLSEGIVIDYAIRVLQMAENVCIIFLIKEQANIHKLRKFQESLILSKNKVQTLVLGKHTLLENMLKPLGTNRVNLLSSSEDWLEKAWNWYLGFGQSQ